MSNPTKGRRSWSLPPKLMKSTKLVSTCEGSRFNDWGARDYVEHVYRASCYTTVLEYTATIRLSHQLLSQRDHLIPIVAVLVVAPEEPNRTRERGGLVVLDGVAAAVQEERVKQRHGQWPQHDEADSKRNNRLVRAGPSALDVERSRQVRLGLAREVVKAEALALEGEEEGARHRW
eukprot:scaffold73035_cov68-Phaeocystis_antarctica.AAC.6